MACVVIGVSLDSGWMMARWATWFLVFLLMGGLLVAASSTAKPAGKCCCECGQSCCLKKSPDSAVPFSALPVSKQVSQPSPQFFTPVTRVIFATPVRMEWAHWPAVALSRRDERFLFLRYCRFLI